MNKLEKVVAKTARTLTERNVKSIACTWIMHQPQISENIRKRLEETK